MSTTSTQYRFSVTSVKIISIKPSHIKQRELCLKLIYIASIKNPIFSTCRAGRNRQFQPLSWNQQLFLSFAVVRKEMERLSIRPTPTSSRDITSIIKWQKYKKQQEKLTPLSALMSTFKTSSTYRNKWDAKFHR